MLGFNCLHRKSTFWEKLLQSSGILQKLPKLFNVLYEVSELEWQ